MSLYRFRRYLRVPQELRPTVLFKQDSLSPSKITVQIILLQIFYYLTAVILFFMFSKIFGYPVSSYTEWLFDSNLVQFDTMYGLVYSSLWLVDSFICCFFLTVIVGRSKLAWDFAITIHAINLLCSTLYTGHLPQIRWWLVQICSSLILIFLGTYMSKWHELRDTFFEDLVEPSGNLADSNSTNAQNSIPPVELKDLEAQKWNSVLPQLLTQWKNLKKK